MSHIYKIDGQRVPGVTTFVNKYGDPGGLVYWAWDLGMKGIDYREARDAAASAGTLAHRAIEKIVKSPGEGEYDFPEDVPEEIRQKALGGVKSFLDWASQTKVEILATEIALVSRKLRCGGTLDALADVDGVRTLLDFKTSNLLRLQHLLQVSAYDEIADENGFAVEQVQLLRLGKDAASFHHHSWKSKDLEPARRAVHRLREMYDLERNELKALM